MSYQLLLGDCVEVMRTLPANSVQTCVTSPPYFGLRSYLPNGHADKHMEVGTEESPDAYVANVVAVFREVRRVLHPTGTCWINLGDSYNGSNAAIGGGAASSGLRRDGRPEQSRMMSNAKEIARRRREDVPTKKVAGLKPKDLIGIPWMVAFALRADGWYLRSEIIWHKKAPMPESVRDRPTKAHEQIFLLSKSPTYFYDAAAIAEPAIGNDPGNLTHKHQNGAGIVLGRKTEPNGGLLNVGAASTRNKRSVWTIGPQNYAEAHFATFPEALIEPCILAGTSAHGCCAKCGAPWERVIEVQKGDRTDARTPKQTDEIYGDNAKSQGLHPPGWRKMQPDKKVDNGWQPTCTCHADVVPCTVLDPFCGSGTTLAVSLKFGRNAIGVELNESYHALAHTRIERTQPMLFAVTL